jgi:hypothetical protein
MIKGFLIIVMLLMGAWVFSQKSTFPGPVQGVLSVGWDNDIMTQTDYYYTQGLNLQFYHQILKENPVNKILITPRSADHVLYGLTLQQQMYTPRKILPSSVQYYDRPYAGVLLLKSSGISSYEEKGWLLQAELSLGVMGPASGAQQVQHQFHALTNNHIPYGWINQHSNWPLLNYDMSASKRFANHEFMEGYLTGGVLIGSLYTDASFGLNLRMGWMNPYMLDLGLPLNIGKRFQAYGLLQPSVSLVGYNATLQGGVSRYKGVYYLAPDEIERVLIRIRSGIGLTYKSVALHFVVQWNSPEFIYGEAHYFHETSLKFSF